MAPYLLCVLLFLIWESNAKKPDVNDSHSQNDTFDFSIASHEQSSSDVQHCPTWFVKTSVNGNTRCECGYTSDDVICNDD